MPLPVSDPKAAWPPPHMVPIFARMTQWSALYSGDLAQIQAAYGGGPMGDSTGYFASDKGGFRATVGRAVQRFFLGEPAVGPNRNTKVPVPIAAELCQGSADMLYSDPIRVTVGRGKDADDLEPGNPTEERLEVLLDDRFHASLAEAAETAAAITGAYLRVTTDPVVPGRPFTTVVAADCAIPEFKFGRLTAVTFTWVVQATDDDVWRHLERHELDSQGNGLVLHGLYHGNQDALGMRVGLQSLGDPAMDALALSHDVNGVEGTIDTRSPGLAVQYLPNQTPNRLWRTHAVGQYLGRSDLDGVEHLIDQLAEVMTAWLRAIRLAKARLFIAKQLTASGGPGNGSIANLEQEAYTSVDMISGENQGLQDLIHLEQPEVNFEQYQATAKALIEQIVQMAGYSPASFGIENGSTTRGGSGGRTATEVNSRDRRSDLTRDRKIRVQKPAIAEHVAKLLAVDNAWYGQNNMLDGIDIVFAESAQDSFLNLSQGVLYAYQSESMSTEQRVARLNPGWDDDKVQDEVSKILEEFAADPTPVFPPLGVTMPDGTVAGGDAGDPDDPTPEQ